MGHVKGLQIAQDIHGAAIAGEVLKIYNSSDNKIPIKFVCQMEALWETAAGEARLDLMQFAKNQSLDEYVAYELRQQNFSTSNYIEVPSADLFFPEFTKPIVLKTPKIHVPGFVNQVANTVAARCDLLMQNH